MNSENQIKKEVEKTLLSLDGVERATADDLFYQRLLSKLEQRNHEISPNNNRELGFAFSMAAVFLLIVLNLISLVFYPKSLYQDGSMDQQEASLSELSNDYQLYDFSYYEDLEEE